MKIKYDKEVDILYIHLSEAKIVESDENKPGIILDYDEKGNISGIEVMNASTKISQPMKFEYVVAQWQRGAVVLCQPEWVNVKKPVSRNTMPYSKNKIDGYAALIKSHFYHHSNFTHLALNGVLHSPLHAYDEIQSLGQRSKKLCFVLKDQLHAYFI